MQTDVNLYYKAALDGTKVQVKGSGTNVSFIQVTNVASNAITYLQLFDALSADVTVGTTVPNMSLAVDAAAAAHVTTMNISFTVPLTFKKGLTIAATTTIAGSSNPSTAVPVMIAYS